MTGNELNRVYENINTLYKRTDETDKSMSGAIRGLGLRIAKLERMANLESKHVSYTHLPPGQYHVVDGELFKVEPGEPEPEPEERPCPPGMPGCPAYNDPGPVLPCEDCHDMYDEPEPKQGHLTREEIESAYHRIGENTRDGCLGATGVVIAAFEAMLTEWRELGAPSLVDILKKHRDAYKRDLEQ